MNRSEDDIKGWRKATEDGWEFPDAGNHMSRLRCKCGSTLFHIFFPQPFMTAAKCWTCHDEVVVHEG